MKRIDEDIKANSYKNVYLIYGEEDYLKNQYKNKLIKALVSDGDNMNFSKYDADNLDVPRIIDLAETMPFFAEHRVILITDSGLMKKSDEAMADYLSNVAAGTIFIFVESEVDKRAKTFKAAKGYERDIEFVMPDENLLTRWMGAKIKAAGKTMKSDAWAEFLNRTDESMDNMDKEFEKLISYVGDRPEITLADVTAICVPKVETKIFDMLNAIAAKDTKAAMDLYNDMLAAKEPPMRILFMIVKQFRQMRVIKELAGHGENITSIAAKTGMRDFAIKRMASLSKNFTVKDIDNLLSEACELEQRVKTGRLDENLAVELIMMKYSR